MDLTTHFGFDEGCFAKGEEVWYVAVPDFVFGHEAVEGVAVGVCFNVDVFVPGGCFCFLEG